MRRYARAQRAYPRGRSRTSRVGSWPAKWIIQLWHPCDWSQIHTRDQEFLERYYEATKGPSTVMYYPVIIGLKTWIETLHRQGLKIPKSATADLDLAEGFSREDHTSH